MTISIATLFTSEYDRETKLWPALAISLAPVITLNLIGIRVGNALETTIGGISLGAVLTVLIANLVHNNGKEFAKRYFGGYPSSVTCLRLRENSGYTVEQRRAKIQEVTHVDLMSKRHERTHPHEADERLSHAVDTARNMMRDQKKYLLLWRALKTYGYWRNMYALKWWGVTVALGSATVSTILDFYQPTLAHAGAALTGVAFTWFWLFGVSIRSFIAASDRYDNEYYKGLFQL